MLRLSASAASVALLVCLAGPLRAAPLDYALPEPTAQLKPPADASLAAGFEAAQGNCMACHSADYLAMQPPGKGAAFWSSEVGKMVKVYHAPIADADAKAIAAYLAATY